MKLKQGYPVTFDISYDITEDGKIPADIQTAKFFLALYPSEADNTYFIKNYNSGLTYSSGIWTVSVDQDDLDSIADTGKWYNGVLAIQYSGDLDFREPDLTDPSGEIFRVYVDPKYSG